LFPQPIEVKVTGDITEEVDELVHIEVVNTFPENVAFVREYLTGTIRNDDPKRVYMPLIFKLIPIPDPFTPPLCNVTYFEDQFNDPNNPNGVWVTGDYPEASYAYIPSGKPNKYEVIHHHPNNGDFASIPISPFGYFTNLELVETKVQWTEHNPESWYGVMFGITGHPLSNRVDLANTMYRFNIRPSIDNTGVSEYRLQRFDHLQNPNNPWSPIQDWIPHPAINGGKRPNVIGVTCKDKARLYVNGTQVWEDPNSSINCSGKIGLASYNGGTSHFDYFLACGSLNQTPISSNIQSWLISGD
jgi:hypothetical protein